MASGASPKNITSNRIQQEREQEQQQQQQEQQQEKEVLLQNLNRISVQPQAILENMYSTVSMSPRVPRKRGPDAGNDSKEEDYEDLDESGKRRNVCPARVGMASNSPPGGARSFSAHDMNSPTMNSSGSSMQPQAQSRSAGKGQWTQFDVERETSENESKEDESGSAFLAEHKRKGGVDVSLYTTKKNVAQGMLGIALLSANCSQLKYLLFHYERDANTLSMGRGGGGGSPGTTNSGASSTAQWLVSFDFYFIVNLVCIACSIALQVIVGILLILNSRHNIYVQRYQRVADSYSNLILLTVFLITIVNIFLSVFISAR